MLHEGCVSRLAFSLDESGELTELNRISTFDGTIKDIISEHPSMLHISEYDCLLCIGRDVCLGEDYYGDNADSIIVSSSGEVFILKFVNSCSTEEIYASCSVLRSQFKVISNWDSEILDSIAADYLYKIYGQAATMLDAFASKGAISYSKGNSFTESVNRNLSSGLSKLVIITINDDCRSICMRGIDDVEVIHVSMYSCEGKTIVVPFIKCSSSFKEPDLCSTETLTSSLSVFSKASGCNHDDLTELVYDLELIDRISVVNSKSGIDVKLSVDGIGVISILSFSVSNGECCIFSDCKEIRNALIRMGHFDSEANDFISTFESFCYDSSASVKYADIDKLIQSRIALCKSIDNLSKNTK